MTVQEEFHNIWERIRSGKNQVFLRSARGVISYGRLADLVTRFCEFFDQKGMVEGNRILILTANEAIAGAAFIAALLDGLIPVMLSADSKPDRVKAVCASLEPALLIADFAIMESLAHTSVPDCLNDKPVVSIPPATQIEVTSGIGATLRGVLNGSKRDLLSAELGLPAIGREPRQPLVDDTTAYILFTSGTSKSPSGVMISRKALIAQIETLTRMFGYDTSSRIFNATPFAHTDGLVQGLLLAVANGAALLRPGPFSLQNLEEWLDRLGQFQATHFITNPTVLALIDRCAAHDDYFDEADFFGILSSASNLRPDLWARLESRFTCSIYNMYGMTETVANATYAGRHPEMGPVGTIGLPVDCEVRLMAARSDHTGEESEREGEIQIRGENVFQGYWKDNARTARTLIGDGWMRTGDLAKRRDDGSLEIVGRMSGVINMGGQSILPEEIDEALALHAAVIDVATIGTKDSEFGEIAVSAVVVDSPASEADLTLFCRQHLEPLKVPKRIIAVDEIPRGGAGKPNAEQLRKMLAELLTSTVIASDTNETGKVSTAEVYELAASVFRVPTRKLDTNSSAANVNGWDSFSQLNLMIEAERRFKVRIPASQVASIRTLGDLHRAITGKL